MESKEKDKLVELTSVQGAMEGDIIKGVLESEGIKALVKGESVHEVLPFTVDGLGKLIVYVRKEDFLKAKVVLSEYREKE
jgi:hypothetical protein